MREKPNTGSLLMALIIAVLAFISGYCLKVREIQQEIIRHDTVIVEYWDTTIIEKPTEIVRYVTRFDTIRKTDTTQKVIFSDSTAIIPIECAIYRDSTPNAKYAAFLSGFRPVLDSIHIECLQTEKIITNTIEKQRRIGFGIQAGIGYSGKITPYIGVGVQYRLW